MNYELTPDERWNIMMQVYNLPSTLELRFAVQNMVKSLNFTQEEYQEYGLVEENRRLIASKNPDKKKSTGSRTGC